MPELADMIGPSRASLKFLDRNVSEWITTIGLTVRHPSLD